MYEELGRPEDAERAHLQVVEIVEKHLELHPDDARALYLGAGALTRVGTKEKAIEWATRALDTERAQ